MLTHEQRAALGQFIRDAKAAAPHIQEMRDTSQELFKQWIASPSWQIAEGEKPDDPPTPKQWNIGAPKVNYVDHIEGEPQP